MRHRSRLFAALALALAVAAPTAGIAAARTPVDPTTLIPPPPDFFNADCQRQGGQILCTLQFADPDLVAEPSGLFCGATELLVDQSRSVVGKRWYDGEGRLVQRHFREVFAGRFVNPETGLEARFVAHDTIVHDLGVPGDLLTGTTRITGQYLRAWAPGGGTLMVDVGTWIEDPANDNEITFRSGHHTLLDWVEGDEAAGAKLCAALG